MDIKKTSRRGLKIIMALAAGLAAGCSDEEPSGVSLLGASMDVDASSDVDFGGPCLTDDDCLDIFAVLECEMAVCAQPYGICVLTTRPSGSPCSDGLICTGPDTCVEGGVCEGPALICDDGHSCTDDVCDEEQLGCVHISNTGAFCDDGDACTDGDSCQKGVCEGEIIEECCQWDPQCNDANPCTEDTCQANRCVNTFTQVPCDDADPCTYRDYCDGAGGCVGTPLPCDDGNACTVDGCDPETGTCATWPAQDGSACDDWNPCTSLDVCQEGVCVGGQSECQCTSDGDCAVLEDGDLCNGTLRCMGNSCVLDPNTAVTCNTTGDTLCQFTVCDPATGQCVPQAAEDGRVCDDQNPCSDPDLCRAGLCVGDPLRCDDLNPCTYDACSPTDGCTYTLNNAVCNDLNPCTANDQCAGGECSGEPMCDDANPCTVDYCDAILGCAWLPQDGPCEDGDACTVGDMCADGLCVPGGPMDCDDDDSCTSDGCVGGACVQVQLMVGSPCDDGDACTGGDLCSESGCVGELALACDDADPCTLDLCVDGECAAEPLNDGVECDAGDLCVLASVCQEGVCVATETVDCSDGNDCSEDVCVAGRCEHPWAPDGSACGGGELCGPAACCNSGVCQSMDVPVCADVLCHDVRCLADQGGCVATPALEGCCGDGSLDEGELCDDGNDFLDDDCDAACNPSGCATRSVLQQSRDCQLVSTMSLLGEVEDLTIEFWVRPSTEAQDAVMFHRREGGISDWFKMTYSHTGTGGEIARLVWHERIADGTTRSVEGPELDPGVWQHVALVRRFSLIGGEIHWYLDGVMQPADGPFVGMIDVGSQDLLYVGCQAGYVKSFLGWMDELRISSSQRYTEDFVPPRVPFEPDDDAVALYHFDDQEPGVAVDQTGAGLHMHWHGADVSEDSPFDDVLPGEQGQAVCAQDFCWPGSLQIHAGIDTSGSIDDPSSLDTAPSFTVEAFLRIEVAEEAVVVARGVAGAPEWMLRYDATSGAATMIWTEKLADGTLADVVSDMPLPLETWHHVAVTRHFDLASSRADVRLYIDGVLTSGCGLLVGAGVAPSGTPLHVGALDDTPPFFHGYLDELRISFGVIYPTEFAVPTVMHIRPNTLALFHLDSRIPADRYNAVPGGFGPLIVNSAWGIGNGTDMIEGCP